MTVDTRLAERFEEHRPYLRAVATRLLSSPHDAEDAVQETWLRLNRVGDDGIKDLRAWLITVTTRIGLDMLRHRGLRRDQQFSMSLDELRDGPAEPPSPELGPEDDVLLAESVAEALHTVLERLTPAERVAFVLHDVFDIPFASIAKMLDRSTDATKMLATRGRRRLRGAADQQPAQAQDRHAVDEFFAAASAGDISRVLAVLAPDLEASHSFADGDTRVLGRDQFMNRARFGASLGGTVRAAIVDGAPGAIVMIDGKPTTALKFEIRDGTISRIWSVTAPDRLAQLVPSWVL